MKKAEKTIKLPLVPENIDMASEQVRDFLESRKLKRRDVIRYSMSVEEILLKNMKQSENPRNFILRTGVKITRPFIEIQIDGDKMNAFAEESENSSMYGEGILRNIGLSPDYQFADGVNVYYFRIRKKSSNPFLPFIIALAAAVVVGAGGFLLDGAIQKNILDGFILPLHDTFLNVLGCIAGPMVFLSVAWGIYGIGDAATLKKVGKNLLAAYTGIVLLSSCVIGCLMMLFFSLNYSQDVNISSGAASIFEMILGIIPKNIISPFLEGNILQIIFLAIIIGISMLFMGQKTNAVAKAVEQINYIVQFLIEFISKLVPYFIFLVVVKLMWSGRVEIFTKVGKFFAVFVGGALLFTMAMILYTAFVNKISPAVLIRKGLPVFAIAVTTASSAAAFGTNMKACQEEFGISKSISSFGLPLGIVAFKPTTALTYIASALYFSEIYQLEISFTWIAIMIFTVWILSIATPPIPGGLTVAYTVLFMQLGIPKEALAVALACEMFCDFISTGLNQFNLPLSLLNRARKLGMVDESILKGKAGSKA